MVKDVLPCLPILDLHFQMSKKCHSVVFRLLGLPLQMGMAERRSWQHKNSTNYKRARMVDMDTPMAGPRQGKERGRRGIVIAVVTPDGILNDSAEFIVSGGKVEDQKTDYHRDMNANNYDLYMRRVLPLFKREADKRGKPAVFITDNASYHNKAIKKPPTSISCKADIKKFLDENNIPYYSGLTRPLLLKTAQNFIKQNGGRGAFTVYEIDEFAKSIGVRLLRLPQYHCFFAPIELVWSQMKNHLRREGKTSDKLEIVRNRTLSFLRQFPAEAARKLFDHTLKLECDIRECQREKDCVDEDEFNPLEMDEEGNLVEILPVVDSESEEDDIDVNEEQEYSLSEDSDEYF
uniref:DDE_3 domain-containing protein n=1 Tax=Caenorhabditis tropicalis TaxID=1561998 RepID=A0A1I7TVF6_9PELO